MDISVDVRNDEHSITAITQVWKAQGWKVCRLMRKCQCSHQDSSCQFWLSDCAYVKAQIWLSISCAWPLPPQKPSRRHPEDHSTCTWEVLEVLPVYSIRCRYRYPCGILELIPCKYWGSTVYSWNARCSGAFSAFLLAQTQEGLLILHCYKSQSNRKQAN